MKKWNIAVLFVYCFCFALGNAAEQREETQIRYDCVPYWGYLDYRSSPAKRHGQFFGLYQYLGVGLNHLFEAGIDYTRINYKTDYTLRQRDFTLVYSNFQTPSWKWRIGGHFVDNNDAFSDHSKTAFLGAHYIGDVDWGAGMDGYYSRYNAVEPRLQVYQVVPRVGFNFCKKENSLWGNVIKGYCIRHSKKTDINRRHFFSIEDKIYFHWKKWSFSAFGWVGKQSLAVTEKGFAVFNLLEEYKRGYGIKIKNAFDERGSVSVSANQRLNSSDNSRTNSYIIQFGYRF